MLIDTHLPKSLSYYDKTDFTKVSAAPILSYMHNYQGLLSKKIHELINKGNQGYKVKTSHVAIQGLDAYYFFLFHFLEYEIINEYTQRQFR